MKKIIVFTLLLLSNEVFARTAEAIFAGGNFWRLEASFNSIKGVLATVTGFDGGTSKDPTYEKVSKGHTQYVHAVRVIYNPDSISYAQIVDYFWRHIDPTVQNAQFCDSGPQYRSAIFYLNEKQKKIALASKKAIEKKFKKIYTEIIPSTQFYAADDEQQAYYQKHPFRYKYYLYRCGNNTRLQEIWGSSAELSDNVR
ncbi:MAG: peptide-methionine (S)-S-oxide reductase MsrA [Legionella sp.]|nr:peptide-methionine (S)-S-oxide reductase MsrA [Legionella sp.]